MASAPAARPLGAASSPAAAIRLDAPAAPQQLMEALQDVTVGDVCDDVPAKGGELLRVRLDAIASRLGAKIRAFTASFLAACPKVPLFLHGKPAFLVPCHLRNSKLSAVLSDMGELLSTLDPDAISAQPTYGTTRKADAKVKSARRPGAASPSPSPSPAATPQAPKAKGAAADPRSTAKKPAAPSLPRGDNAPKPCGAAATQPVPPATQPHPAAAKAAQAGNKPRPEGGSRKPPRNAKPNQAPGGATATASPSPSSSSSSSSSDSSDGEGGSEDPDFRWPGGAPRRQGGEPEGGAKRAAALGSGATPGGRGGSPLLSRKRAREEEDDDDRGGGSIGPGRSSPASRLKGTAAGAARAGGGSQAAGAQGGSAAPLPARVRVTEPGGRGSGGAGPSSGVAPGGAASGGSAAAALGGRAWGRPPASDPLKVAMLRAWERMLAAVPPPAPSTPEAAAAAAAAGAGSGSGADEGTT